MMAGGGPDTRSTAGGPARHIPVLLPQIIEALSPKDGGIFIDATFGRGGYARGLLDAADCSVLGIDRDPDAIAAGETLAARYAPRLRLRVGRFSDMEALAAEAGFATVDGIALDIGVSSPQLDDPARGFSFSQDGPLDMRMSREGRSAADAVNGLPEEQLAEVIFRFGEERRSRAIARAIVAERERAAILSTSQLADIVSRVLGRRHDDPKHPATRTFQALRLFVNDELGELVRGLGAAERLLRAGGRLAVVTFHSLEDRIVKRFFSERSRTAPQGSRHHPERGEGLPASFRQVVRGAVTPEPDEVAANPRARSARLRFGERTAAPAQPIDASALGAIEVQASLG